MAKNYEKARPPRFEIEQGPWGDRIRIPARRNFVALPFLVVWVTVWTIGGIHAFVDFARTGGAFFAFWLALWSTGWVLGMLFIAWMIAGSEVLRVASGDLEIGHSLFGWMRVRTYRGAEIEHLSASESPPFHAQLHPQFPFMKPQSGSIKFSYGARTVYAAQGLDEAEGRMIVEWLRRRLPAAV